MAIPLIEGYRPPLEVGSDLDVETVDRNSS
jgi:hypothetical protein